MRWPRSFQRSAPPSAPAPPSEAHTIDVVESVVAAAQAATKAALTIVDGLELGYVSLTPDEAIELRKGLVQHMATMQHVREQLAAARKALEVPRHG
jgi:hypothetical protein